MDIFTSKCYIFDYQKVSHYCTTCMLLQYKQHDDNDVVVGDGDGDDGDDNDDDDDDNKQHKHLISIRAVSAVVLGDLIKLSPEVTTCNSFAKYLITYLSHHCAISCMFVIFC